MCRVCAVQRLVLEPRPSGLIVAAKVYALQLLIGVRCSVFVVWCEVLGTRCVVSGVWRAVPCNASSGSPACQGVRFTVGVSCFVFRAFCLGVGGLGFRASCLGAELGVWGLVVGGWWLVVGGWWLVVFGWCLVVGG